MQLLRDNLTLYCEELNEDYDEDYEEEKGAEAVSEPSERKDMERADFRPATKSATTAMKPVPRFLSQASASPDINKLAGLVRNINENSPAEGIFDDSSDDDSCDSSQLVWLLLINNLLDCSHDEE